MSHPVRLTVLIIIGLGLAMQLVRPAMTNPPSDPANAIKAHVPIPADVEGILNRSCGDCHSNNTTWPWYDRIAPASWFVTDHVNEGRRTLNFSDWNAHSRRRTTPPIGDICEQVKSREMPLWSYLLIHRYAHMSDADIAAVCAWSQGAAAAIKAK